MTKDLSWQDNDYLFENSGKLVTVHTKEDFYAIPESDRIRVNISDILRCLQPIQDTDEPLIALENFLKENKSKIILSAGETQYGAQTLDNQKMRLTAAEKLFEAEKYLQTVDSNLTFKVTDSYRPLSLQKKYFEEVWEKFSDQGLVGQDLYIAVSNVISDPGKCPPHSTGGTIDVTLFDLANNQELDLGTPVDKIDDPKTYTFDTTIINDTRKYRLILYTSLIQAGFVNAPVEWWHYSYGDQEWAIRTGAPVAIYDSIK